jgi:putative DNA primase/helicase
MEAMNFLPDNISSIQIQEISNPEQEKTPAQILKSLLTHITAQSPHEAANISEDKSLSEKDLVVITVDYVLKISQKNKWEMASWQNSYFVYTGTHWKKLTEDELKDFLGKAAEKINIDKFLARHYTFRNNLHSQFHDAGLFTPPISDTNETKINLTNGTFVITKEQQYLKPWDSNDFLLYKLNFSYNPEAKAPKFQKYLDRVLPDKSKQLVLAEFMAYVFIKNSVLKLEKALILFGDGHNGKSVFFDVIMKVLGPENVCSFSLQSLTDNKGYHLSMLTGKLLNYASELSSKLDTPRFKLLVSGEPIEARQIYGKPFILTDYARFMFNTNVLPKDVEINMGYFRRFLLMHFDQTISEEEKDANLANTIITYELSGVFNWIMGGLERLLAQGNFSKSIAIDNALEDYKLSSDTVHLFLNDGNYIPSDDKKIQLKNLYSDYREYCKDSGYIACSLKTYADRLRNYQYDIIRTEKGRWVFIEKNTHM